MEKNRLKTWLITLMGIAFFSLPTAYLLDVGIASALISVVLPFGVISYLLIRGLSPEERSEVAGLIKLTQWFYISLLATGALLMVLIGVIFSGG